MAALWTFWRRTFLPALTGNSGLPYAASTLPAARFWSAISNSKPILSSEEDQPVTVPEGFDPAAIKLVGNVTGEPPIRGLLRHRGWRVTEVTLPSLPQGSGRAIVAPAEVEVP